MNTIKKTGATKRVAFRFKSSAVASQKSDDTTSVISNYPSCGCPTGLK